MSNFETLFKKNSVNNIRQYQKHIREMRKNDKSRNGKIESIVNQVQYMNTMHNIGNKFGGNEPIMNLNVSKDIFEDYDDKDVNYLFNTLSVPYSSSKKSILGHMQNTHNTIKYLNLSDEKFDDSESESLDQVEQEVEQKYDESEKSLDQVEQEVEQKYDESEKSLDQVEQEVQI